MEGLPCVEVEDHHVEVAYEAEDHQVHEVAHGVVHVEDLYQVEEDHVVPRDEEGVDLVVAAYLGMGQEVHLKQ